MSQDRKPCKYFQRGDCKFGGKCVLLHIIDGRIVNDPLKRSDHSVGSQQQMPGAGVRVLSIGGNLSPPKRLDIPEIYAPFKPSSLTTAIHSERRQTGSMASPKSLYESSDKYELLADYGAPKLRHIKLQPQTTMNGLSPVLVPSKLTPSVLETGISASTSSVSTVDSGYWSKYGSPMSYASSTGYSYRGTTLGKQSRPPNTSHLRNTSLLSQPPSAELSEDPFNSSRISPNPGTQTHGEHWPVDEDDPDFSPLTCSYQDLLSDLPHDLHGASSGSTTLPEVHAYTSHYYAAPRPTGLNELETEMSSVTASFKTTSHPSRDVDVEMTLNYPLNLLIAVLPLASRLSDELDGLGDISQFSFGYDILPESAELDESTAVDIFTGYCPFLVC